MNHIYRLCWNRTLKQWVPASELAQRSRSGMCRSHAIGHRVMMLSLLSAALGMTGLAHAGSAPSGGQIVGGSGSIQQAGNTTTIQQNSQVLSLNWQNFDIGADQTVNFLQPGASSIAVNRILGNTASEIYGHLNANGQVWLINPNGVIFGKGSQVNVGGIVASTLDVDDSSIGSGSVRFAGDGKGKVTNQGSIAAANGGYVALIGNQVSNQGVIRAQLGMVALGGGSAVTLTFNDNHLVHLQVDKSTIKNMVENRQLIVADGGTVLMTAGARDSLLASVVNNTGTVQARSVEDHNGTITLLGGMEAGTVEVGGTLDASAPNGGNGGKIETSAANFQLATDAKITAAAPQGKAGTWLVDPTDLIIDTAAANTISTTLNQGTNVTETTSASGASGFGTQQTGNGDITINAGISWTNAAATLELDALRNINVNAAVSGSGGIVMNASSGTLTIASAGGLSAGAGTTVQASKFVNNANASALGSNWKLFTANPSLNTLGGLTPNFIQYNANINSTLSGSGNALVYTLAPTLQVNSLTGSTTKTYDATNLAFLTGANFNTTGLQAGDVIVSGTGTYSTANAGNNLTVTSPASLANMVIANNGVQVFGYTLIGAQASAKIGQITPKQLTAEIVGDPTKVYDGTTTATLSASNYQIDGFLGTDGATVKQPSSIAYAGSDAGTQQVNASFSVTNFTATSGTNLSNYVLPTTATGQGLITQAPLLVSGLLANSKIYDGTTADSIVTSGATLFGVIAPDQGKVALDTSGVVGSFTQSNVGNGIGVNLSGFVLTGDQAHNYQLIAPTNLTANITPKTLTIDQVIANNKTYDNTTAATLNTGSAVLDGVVGSDNVTLNSGSATAAFGQTDAGTHLDVTTSGFALGGTAAGNYVLTQPSLFANINPALLSISMTGTPEKIYDGTNAVNLGASNFNITGFIGSQSAVVSQSSASYATANAGSGITVTATLQPSDFSPANGTSMSNYTFAPTVVGTNLGKIDPLQLTGQIVNNPTKVYDGNTDAPLSASNFQLVGLVPGQSINASFSGTVSGTYDDPNAGARGVTAGSQPTGNFTAGNGTLLSNYILPNVWNGSGTITPAPLTGSFVLTAGIVDATKVYDGSYSIVLNSANFTLSGFVNGDSAVVNDGITGTFGQKDVGTNIPLSAQLSINNLTATGSTTQQELNNYQIVNPVLGVGNITPRPLDVTIIGNPTKVYNGSTDVSLNSSNFNIVGWATGEGGSINPTATSGYDAPDAGTRTVTAVLTPGNYVVNSGTKLSNYTIATSAEGTGLINKAPLFITGVFATNRAYNTTTADTLNLTNAALAGLVDSDAGDASKVALNLSSVVANFTQANVGNGLTVNASGFGITGSESGNYTLQPVTGLFANITPALLTLTGITASEKTYDATTTATLGNLTGGTLNGIFSGDTVGYDSSNAKGQFITANAGTNLGVSVTGFTLNGADAGNYQLQQPTGLTATIDPKQLTATIIGSPTKVYDGTNSATLTAADYELDGFVNGDGATVPQSATAHYGTKNVGTGLEVDSTLVTSDFLANPGTNLSNYVLPTGGQGFNGVIEAKVLDLTGTRVYDGTTTGDSSLFGTLQGVNGETLNVSGSGTLSSKNVGSQWSFTSLGSLALADGGNGGLASNYTLIGGTDWVTITPRQITASFDANDKTYDATTNDVLTNAALEAANGNRGLIAGDNVTLNNATSGHFSDKNVGTGKTVTGNMSISGDDAGNYVFTNGTSTATINALHITVTATGKDKQYDATVNDPGTTVQSAGVIGGDTVNFGYGSATFSDKDVGNNKTVTVTGVSKSGADSGNYIVDNTTLTTQANITPRVINLSSTRVYDSTTHADSGLFTTGGLLNTGFGGESLTLTGSGNTADKNVGNNKTFNLGTLALGDGNNGGLASNYTLIGGTDKLTITKAALNYSFTASDKTYDGTTAATIGNQALTGLFAGDTISVANPNTAHFSDKNVGTNKTVTGDMTFGGTDIGNYNVTVQTTTASITPLTITVDAQGVNKVYDGNTSDNALLSSSGIKGTDQVSFSGTSVFDDKNVGTNKNVSVSGITASGTDANNYVLANSTATTHADITPFIINLHSTRVYDGTTNVSSALFGSNGVINGTAGETLSLNGSSNVANKNVGNNKGFAGSTDMTLGDLNGSLASNYQIGTSTLDITPLAITGNITADNKIYDATTAAVTHGALTGVLAGDTVNFITSGTFSDKNAANGKTVSLTSSLSGTDAGNYIYSANSTTTANITPLAITVDATAANKTYDTTTSALITSLTSNGILGSDVVNFTAVSADFSDANAANGKTVNVVGIAKSGVDANNYTINTTAQTIANITPVVLNLSGTRVYDGTTGADANLFGNNGVITGIAGQTINLVGSGQVGDKNVGSNKPFASLGTLALQDGGNGGLAQNYTLIGGLDDLTITPATLTATTTALSRDYDGTNLVQLSGSALSGLIGGDDVILGNDTQGTFADKNAATGKAVTTNMTISGGDASNYVFNQPTGVVADVNPLAIVVDVTAANKNYDTTSNAVLTGIGSTGILGNDDVNFTFGSANFSDANAANGKVVSVTGIAKNGADAGNYTINTTAQTTADISPLVINLSGTRAYDGSTGANANLFGNNGVITGIAGQTINLVGSGQVGDKNVGSNKPFTSLGTLALQDGGNGGLAQNYTLIGGTDDLTITPKAITLGATADNKTYDANNLANTVVTGNGLVAGDDIQFAPGSATFATPNAGNNIAVSVTGITASGADAGNYSFANTASTAANITPVVLDLTGTRVYDGSTGADANLFGANGVLTGIAGQTINLVGSGQVGDKNVGSNKPFASLGTLALQDGGNGGLAQNYTLVGGSDALSITPRQITVDATGSNKTYDGGTTAGVSLGSTGVLSGDQVSFTPGSADYASPNAGNGIAINVAGITAGGTDAGNYSFVNTATTSGNITPVVLDLTGTRVYDGTAGAAASLFGDNGVLTGVNGETLTLSGTGTLGDKNVGSQKGFATGGLGGFTLTGNGSALAGNYTFAGGTDWVSITPATLTVIGTQTTDRTYDGTRIDTLTGATLSGVFGNDDVILGNAGSGLFDTKNVGNGKSVTTAMTVSGGDVGNYILVQPTNLTANVTPRAINVTATGTDKMFDGNTIDKVSLNVTGVLDGDQVTVTNKAANFTDDRVGNDKTVIVSGLAANGGDAANYVIVDPTITTTADITGAQPSAFGVNTGAVTQMQDVLGPTQIATPYGVADQDTVGAFTGNQKKQHRPIERNRARDDFTSGLALKVVGGGVQMPVQALP
ncbi:YDG domain-containing protein [Dyella sp.]|uniref:YDG domain-containing protein n=1 Tax=Dyella sp. TaxID=1869338 RepID=UPI002ED54206